MFLAHAFPSFLLTRLLIGRQTRHSKPLNCTPNKPSTLSKPDENRAGELQAVYSDGHAGRQLVVHHANRLPDEHSRVGSRRLQIHGFHEDRHAALLDISRARMPYRASGFPFLSGWGGVVWGVCCSGRMGGGMGGGASV